MAPVPEGLRHEFEELGLSPYEAGVLLTLMRLGSANSAQLARVSQVPRTSIYQVMEELTTRRLAERLPGDGPAVWATPGRDEVLGRLDAAQEEKLRQHRARAARVKEMLPQHLPEAPSVAMPYVHVLRGPRQIRSVYDRLLSEAGEEVLVFNRPPYSSTANPVRVTDSEAAARDEVNPLVLAALARGVSLRVLYRREQWEDPAAESFRTAMNVYHDAGVRGRLTDELPIKLAVADRKIALLAMMEPTLSEIGFPTSLLVEHPGCASIQADAFEHRWAAATRCPAAEVQGGRTSRRPAAWRGAAVGLARSPSGGATGL